MKGIDASEALAILDAEGPDLADVLARASRVRRERRGREVILCAILNAKSGACPEDCAFCAQSSVSRAAIERHPLVEAAAMIRASREAAGDGAARFSIVTSGKRLAGNREIASVCEALGSIAREGRVEPCASLGILGRSVLERLRDAGLSRYHHNLETAESFYRRICTTRAWSESVKTIEAAKEAGLRTCSGGLFGLGETNEQRVELLEAIRSLEVDSVPLNFLHPVEGTPLAGLQELSALDGVRITAAARLMMPGGEIRIAGGREVNLRDLQSWLLLAGADGLMIGGYLTTAGRRVEDDVRMIEDAGFAVSTRGKGPG